MQFRNSSKWIINALIALPIFLLGTSAYAQNRAQYNGFVTGKYFKMPKFNGWDTVNSMNGECEVINATKADGSGQFATISICPKGRRDSAFTVAEVTPILRQQITAEASRLAIPGCKKAWVDAYQGNISQAKGYQMIQQCGESPAPYTTSRVGIFSMADLEVRVTNRFTFPAPKDGIAEGTELIYYFELK